jgi:hypothetical protein
VPCFYSERANTDAASDNNTRVKEPRRDIDLAPEWRLGVRYCVAFAFIMSAAFSAMAYVGPIKCAHRPMGMTEATRQFSIILSIVYEMGRGEGGTYQMHQRRADRRCRKLSVSRRLHHLFQAVAWTKLMPGGTGCYWRKDRVRK